MPSEYDNDLLREGIFHYKVKEYDLARKYIERAVENADDLQTRAQANYYLSLLTDDPIQKRKYLEETLAIDLAHAEARRALAILDGKLKPGEIVNPDSMPAANTGVTEVRADRFTCPKCGGRMVFAPDGVSLHCEYCNHNQRLPAGEGSGEQDFFLAMANGSGQRAPVAEQTFQCQGCGANFVLAPDELSATCAYCGSPHVVALETKLQMIEPDAILPMGLDLNQASWGLVHWVEEMKIKPQGKVEAPRGLYLPVWTFDISGNVPWKGTVYRDKREVAISGEKSVHFYDVRILGSKRMASLMTLALPEFDFSNAPAYDARYISGWMANVYDLPMAEASLEARRVSVEQVRWMIRDEFRHVQNLGYSTSGLMVSAFKLILVPAWVTEVRINDQIFHVLINGRTGSVHSELQRREGSVFHNH
jgi:hypothetical protein